MDDTISRLTGILERVPGELAALSEARSLEKRIAGKWCAKEVLGHLIDSASNNHQRFVRAQLAPSFEGPSYSQNEWVGTQAYVQEPWAELVELWTAYNRHLVHVMRVMNRAALRTTCVIGGGEAVTLEFVVADYVAHMEHHLQQILI